LKAQSLNDCASLRKSVLLSLKSKSMGFYENILDKTLKLSEGDIQPKDLKSLIDARVIAENRIYLLAKEELIAKNNGEVNSGGLGLLDEFNAVGG
ncbi:MAG: hypothetical protein ACRC6A_07990, partial [Fusobacteriaceae bacterium]